MLVAAFTIATIQMGQWSVVSDGILAELSHGRPKSNDPYTAGTAGVSVDRTNGEVYLLANNIGICKSRDQGKTFSLVSGTAVTGRFKTGWGLNIDPKGGRLMCFAIYGSSGYSSDAGKSWTPSKLSHLDYGAVDWYDSGRALLAIGHESGGKLVYSPDAGTSWSTLGTGYWAVGLFGRQTLMAADERKPGILRSTDGGLTWNQVSDEPLAAPVMVEFRGVGYWLGQNGLLKSVDKGATWSVISPVPKGSSLGPMFGRDEHHLVIAASDGLYESSDSGRTWTLSAPLAPEIKVLPRGKYGTYGWDPIHRTFYASQMMKPAFRGSDGF